MSTLALYLFYCTWQLTPVLTFFCLRLNMVMLFNTSLLSSVPPGPLNKFAREVRRLGPSFAAGSSATTAARSTCGEPGVLDASLSVPSPSEIITKQCNNLHKKKKKKTKQFYQIIFRYLFHFQNTYVKYLGTCTHAIHFYQWLEFFRAKFIWIIGTVLQYL